MSWNSKFTVVLRGSTVNDPENTSGSDPGFCEVELAFATLDAWPDVTGEATEFGDGARYSHFGARESIEAELMPFTKGTNSGDLMDGGRVRKFIDQIVRKPFYWIYRVYSTGTNHSGSFVPRAEYDPTSLTSTTSEDTFWNLTSDTVVGTGRKPGNLPMRVVMEPSRPEHVGGGVYEWRVKFFKGEEEA